MYALVVVVATLMFAHSSHCWVNMNNKLVGKVIHVESLRYRRGWLNAHRSKWAKISGCLEKKVYFYKWTQFLVRRCNAGYICLESIRYRNYYVDAHYSGYVKIGFTMYPKNKNWAVWRITCEDTSLRRCVFYTPLYNKYLDAHHSKWAKTARYGYWSDFRILAPNATESYVTVFDTINQSNLKQKKEVTLSVGINKSREVSHSISASVSLEIADAFVTAGSSLNHAWAKTRSQTFRASKTIKYTIHIPAGSRVVFKQLRGNYGPFSVNAKYYLTNCTNLATKRPCKLAGNAI